MMGTKMRANFLGVVVTILIVSPALAAGDDAADILKAMSDYLTSQNTISAKYNSDIEVITPDLQKIQFNSSGTLLINRPNQIRATRIGGYSNIEMFFDGTTFTVYSRNNNRYFQLAAPGSIETLIGMLPEYSVAIPGADLLMSEPYEKLMARVIDAKHIGIGVIGDFECDHLAFRTQDTDWQLWVQTGSKPIPRKFVITSKAIGAAPQYTLVIDEWKTDIPPDATAFVFKPPGGSSKMGLAELKTVDELPPGAPAKGLSP